MLDLNPGTDGSNPFPSSGESSKLRHRASRRRLSSDRTRHSTAEIPGGRVALCWPFWFPLIALEHQHVPRDRSAILELNSHGEIVAITIERGIDILERRGARSEQAGGRASCRDRGERNEVAYRLGDVRFEAAAPGASKAARSTRLAGDLPLFNAARRRTEPVPRESAAAALLRDTRFDELTPRDAVVGLCATISFRRSSRWWSHGRASARRCP